MRDDFSTASRNHFIRFSKKKTLKNLAELWDWKLFIKRVMNHGLMRIRENFFHNLHVRTTEHGGKKSNSLLTQNQSQVRIVLNSRIPIGDKRKQSRRVLELSIANEIKSFSKIPLQISSGKNNRKVTFDIVFKPQSTWEGHPGTHVCNVTGVIRNKNFDIHRHSKFHINV